MPWAPWVPDSWDWQSITWWLIEVGACGPGARTLPVALVVLGRDETKEKAWPQTVYDPMGHHLSVEAGGFVVDQSLDVLFFAVSGRMFMFMHFPGQSLHQDLTLQVSEFGWLLQT